MKILDPAPLSLSANESLRAAMTLLDRTGVGIVLALDEGRRFAGTITDGDVRRAILAELPLDAPLTEVLAQKAQGPFARPLTAAPGTSHAELARLMRGRGVRHLPLVGPDGGASGLAVADPAPPAALLLEAVVMAGGFGTRLLPLTKDVPKPMLPVGDKPLLERLVLQLRDAGVQQVSLTTHYQADKIRAHFGDGAAFGVSLEYVAEEKPLGTAGALGLLPPSDRPRLVINGDILTRVDFRAMLAFHEEQKADLTVGVRQYELQVPYGIIHSRGAVVERIEEKPRLSFFVNAGIYLLSPSAHAEITPGERLDMPDLIGRLIAKGRTVASFPVHEYWLDIGRLSDYEQAQRDVESWRSTS
ncbi:MAG TPA: nucleotidyltransferase family protein [Candidatus Thermoplasmatota archaeon]|nr:nucleotidyltransferase family protein [Candidatus Thermoplasmatota archaeon]